MNRFDIINYFIRKYNYKSYLELGVQWGGNFRQIICLYKISVDPDLQSVATNKVTSNCFFKNNKETFDIIFIDGLHLAHQVDLDIENSLNVLNNNGTIVMHDCYPQNEREQLETWDHKAAWVGTTWKSFVKLRATRADLEMFVIDTDHGCGLIRRGSQKLIQIPEKLEYKDFAINKTEWLNLIPIDKLL